MERIPDHALYLVYGTADPLFLHAELLSKKLVELGVLFYQQVRPVGGGQGRDQAGISVL